MSGKKREKNKEYTEAILDSIADGVFTVDMDWNITYLNMAAAQGELKKSQEAFDSSIQAIDFGKKQKFGTW